MAPKYVKVIPSLPVTSIPKAIEYYCDVLGFRVAGRDLDDHIWLQLVTHEDEDKYNAPVNVYLRRRGFQGPQMPLEEDAQYGKIYVRIAGDEGDLETLLESLKRKGAILKTEISAKPWGLKDFTILDHDGNEVNFSQAIPGWKPPARTVIE